MTRLQPMDVLEVGTPVWSNGWKGVVKSVEQKRDQFGAPIMVHTIKFTERFKCVTCGKARYVPIDPPVVQATNYASIQY